MAIQLLMAAQRQLLQRVDQVTAVAALLSQSQVLAQASILMREVGNVGGLGFTLLQLRQLLGEGLPLVLVAAFKRLCFMSAPTNHGLHR